MKKTVLSIIFASLITASSVMMFSGCGNKETSTPDEATTSTVATFEETTSSTSPTATTVPAVTVPKEVKDLVDKGEIKVDKDGNITDKNGKKVEVKDGKVEVKTDDGKTVTVKVNDVKTTVSNNNNGNKGNTEKKENTPSKKDNTSKTNTSDNDKKPAKPSNSSSNNQKPAKPSNSSKVQPVTKDPHEGKTYHEAVYKYYKHHDAVTKHHDKEWIVTGSHEEPVYKYGYVNVCNNCGKQLLTDKERKAHLTWELETNGAGAYHAEEQRVQVGTKTVEDGYWKEAYTETVKKAYDEEVSANDDYDRKVLVKEAGWY